MAARAATLAAPAETTSVQAKTTSAYAETTSAQAETTPTQAVTAATRSDERGHWPDAIIVNALGGLEDPNPTPSDERAVRDALASGLTAVNVTLGHVFGAGEPFEITVRDIAKTDSQIRANPNNLLKVYTAADILRAKAEHKVGLIYGFQNAAMLGNDASRVEIFARLGVRVVQLTYNGPNALGDGSMVAENRGLSPFGHEVVERLNANQVMVDLSHSGQRICLDAARASRQPISINHTGCRALVDVPRNKTDEELRLVAAKGGFVGIYFMPFLSKTSHPTADDVVAHIEHAVNVCGEDAVGIGTDGSVTAIDDLTAYRAVIAQENADRRKAGISAPGEGPDIVPFVVNLRGVNQFYELADRLQQKGVSTGRVEKILGRNFVRYARDVWGA
ncbi:MAG: membrane dipeptidase [Proteobacteria bacterium]|nr:membrane dipeptidase [Pseudomonadota bacterium]